MTIITTKIKGITIRYLELNKEGKEAIIFLHYGGSSLGVWNGVIPYFEETYHIIAPDLRLHGFSEMDTEDCHIDDMAEDVVNLMIHLGVERARIVGSSLGADVAVSIAANYPEKTSCLVLDGGLYDLDGPDSKDQLLEEVEIEKAKNDLKNRVLSRELKIYESKEEFLKSTKTQWEKYFPWTEIIQKAALDDIKETTEGKYAPTQSPEIIWKYIEPLYGLRFHDYFNKIKCPVLWLPDEKECDHEIVKRNLKEYAKNLPYHKIVTLEGSVHAYTCLLKPEEFSNEIMSFFKEIKDIK